MQMLAAIVHGLELRRRDAENSDSELRCVAAFVLSGFLGAAAVAFFVGLLWLAGGAGAYLAVAEFGDWASGPGFTAGVSAAVIAAAWLAVALVRELAGLEWPRDRPSHDDYYRW